MSPAEHADAKREAELKEAHSHLIYFEYQKMGIEYAIGRMRADFRLCEKNVKLWEGRIEAMKGVVLDQSENGKQSGTTKLGGKA